MRRFLFLLLTFGLLFGGCATAPLSGNGTSRTVLGLVTVEDKAFTPTGNTTFALAEGEVLPNAERTGRKVTLLWGLITYTDY